MTEYEKIMKVIKEVNDTTGEHVILFSRSLENETRNNLENNGYKISLWEGKYVKGLIIAWGGGSRSVIWPVIEWGNEEHDIRRKKDIEMADTLIAEVDRRVKEHAEQYERFV